MSVDQFARVPIATARWTRLDLHGKDSASVFPIDSGYLLQGTAKFEQSGQLVQVGYSVTTDVLWNTTDGSVTGLIGARRVKHSIRHTDTGWLLDGNLTPGLNHLVDLDYDFTPATNYIQVQRMALPIAQCRTLPVAWFQLDPASIAELPQLYERIAQTSYRYVAPSCGYEGLLELAENGFIRRYPRLWEMQL
jgi:hypothetical protein